MKLGKNYKWNCELRFAQMIENAKFESYDCEQLRYVELNSWGCRALDTEVFGDNLGQ